MPADDNSTIAPGQSKRFRYLGEFIPNQVSIQNLSPNAQSNYTVKSGPQSWTYFGFVPPRQTQSIYVQWPTGLATFTNTGGGNIRVFGDGIFPVPPGEAE